MDATADAIQGLRPDGRLVVMGVEAKPLMVSPFDLLTERIKIIGSQQNGREYLYKALAIAASGKVRRRDGNVPARRDRQSLRACRKGKSQVPSGRHHVVSKTRRIG